MNLIFNATKIPSALMYPTFRTLVVHYLRATIG
jgi:hypothetical protein